MPLNWSDAVTIYHFMAQELNNIIDRNANFPIRESAFYNQIKSSTETGDSASFALIMSMLTTDAKELDEFHLPHIADSKIKSDLYGQFNVREKQLTGNYDQERSVAFNQLVQQGHKVSVDLELALQPEPLIAEPDKFSKQLLDNLDPNVKSRLDKEQAEPEQAPFVAKVEKEIDVESWFKVLHESRTIATAA